MSRHKVPTTTIPRKAPSAAMALKCVCIFTPVRHNEEKPGETPGKCFEERPRGLGYYAIREI